MVTKVQDDEHVLIKIPKTLLNTLNPNEIQIVSTIPATGTNETKSFDGIFSFLHICYNLKRTKRTGWLKRSISDGESISDHMYMLAILAMIFCGDEPGINRERCIQMALVHDMAEAIVGDLTPECGVSRAEKHHREHDAIITLTSLLDCPNLAQQIIGLWKEYEQDATPEARLVKDLDKLELAIQAYEYEQERARDFSEFVNTVESKLRNEKLMAFYADLKKRRNS